MIFFFSLKPTPYQTHFNKWVAGFLIFRTNSYRCNGIDQKETR